MQNVNHDLDSCVDCKACMKGCLMLHEFTDSPKSLLTSFQENKPSANMSFSCATCNYCHTVCPVDISFQNLFSNAKIEHAKDDKVLNSFGYKAVLFHQKNSFSKLFTTKTRFTTGLFKNVAFMPGCALSSYSPQLVQKIYKHLQTIMPGINVLQQCCGQPTRIVGDMQRFKTLYSKLQDDIDTMQADVVITACENCYMSLSEFSPQTDVVTLYEILAEHGIPEEKKNSFTNFEKVAIHDPCPTRNHAKLHESIRNIMDLMGLEYEEFKHNKAKTECCGSGGMLELTNPKLASEQMQSRANQTKCENILTYCQSCAESMTKGGKNGIHILDLLFEDEVNHNFVQKQNGTLIKWYNRYKSKKLIEKIEEAK